MSILSLHPGRVRKDNRALCILSIRYSQRHKIVGYFHGTTVVVAVLPKTLSENAPEAGISNNFFYL
jgi:hypothetical protein